MFASLYLACLYRAGTLERKQQLQSHTPVCHAPCITTANDVLCLYGLLHTLQNLSTPFGAFLDPVADKLMVAAVLILLSTQPLAAGPLAGNTWLVPVATLGELIAYVHLAHVVWAQAGYTVGCVCGQHSGISCVVLPYRRP